MYKYKLCKCATIVLDSHTKINTIFHYINYSLQWTKNKLKGEIQFFSQFFIKTFTLGLG